MTTRLALAAGLSLILAATPAFAAEPKLPTPLGNPGEWVTTEDYPTEALRQEWQGAVSFTLDVDKAGRVENCTVVVSSGHELLDVTACNLITQRAIFQPATDRRGRPTVGRYSNRVRWAIPGDDEAMGPALPSSTLEADYLIGIDGQILECTIKQRKGEFQRDQEMDPCKSPPPVGPMLDAAGKPQKRRVHVLVQVDIQPVP